MIDLLGSKLTIDQCKILIKDGESLWKSAKNTDEYVRGKIEEFIFSIETRDSEIIDKQAREMGAYTIVRNKMNFRICFTAEYAEILDILEGGHDEGYSVY